MSNNHFPSMLSGGHPNSLGRTVEVVELIFADPLQLENLYQCYFDTDEVVRLRTSSAMKRIWREKPEWIVPYIDRFTSEISQIDQASTRWTLAQLFLELEDHLTPDQQQKATLILQKNLLESDDWIVLINSIETLAEWAKDNDELKSWLKSHLTRLTGDPRKSVAAKASKLMKALYQ